MLKISASAVALTLGLLVASAIMAAQSARADPHAQMNRALYPTLKVAGHPYVPPRALRRVLPVSQPVAQMNRASYRR